MDRAPPLRNVTELMTSCTFTNTLCDVAARSGLLDSHMLAIHGCYYNGFCPIEIHSMTVNFTYHNAVFENMRADGEPVEKVFIFHNLKSIRCPARIRTGTCRTKVCRANRCTTGQYAKCPKSYYRVSVADPCVYGTPFVQQARPANGKVLLRRPRTLDTRDRQYCGDILYRIPHGMGVGAHQQNAFLCIFSFEHSSQLFKKTYFHCSLIV